MAEAGERAGPAMVRRTYALELRSSTEDLAEGIFRGHAAVFGGPPNWYGEILHPGCFTRTLREHRDRVRVLWQHHPWEPVGLPTAMAEDAVGLAVEARLSKTSRGSDAIVLLQDRVITKLSIGFDPISWDFEKQPDGSLVIHVRDVDLWEFSLVTWAAEERAEITDVRSVSAAWPPAPPVGLVAVMAGAAGSGGVGRRLRMADLALSLAERGPLLERGRG